MKTLYLECNMGAAGDMLMAALLELHPEPEQFLQTMNHMGLPGVTVSAEKKETCGVVGTHMHGVVSGREAGHAHEHRHEPGHDHDHECHEHHHDHGHDHECHEHDHDHGHEGHDHDHECHEHSHDHHHDHDHTHDHAHSHHHASLPDISHMISHLELPETVKAQAQEIYASIAEAESRAHGKPVSEIHFHEVGTLDAVADVVGVCLLLHQLEISEIIASPVHVGAGHVHCAHGVLPVPAPATATLLTGIPTYGGDVEGELCTPTGAALLRYFVKSFGSMPEMTVEKIGYGVGTKEFSRANMLRAMLGTRTETAVPDLEAEDVSAAAELLREAGALEVYTVPVTMKKSRAGVVFTCICRREDRVAMAELMFRHLSTLGIRENLISRYVLAREIETRQTELGTVRVKISRGFGVEKEKPELEDLLAIARDTGLSLREIRVML